MYYMGEPEKGFGEKLSETELKELMEDLDKEIENEKNEEEMFDIMHAVDSTFSSERFSKL